MENTKKITYEEARTRLSEIVNILESGNEKLEDSIKLWQEGSELAKFCETFLKKAEDQMSALENAEK
ncbi:MAG: exodeoxyribonuclease VII small subunit [Candidatus Ancillula sp.]|jgi:exodeoxyribonuclease VII small subunit|nr:exodeoxyribonuclease VII small subunit [Candidatus Ancillula sp.]